MKLQIYSIYDSKVGAFVTPVFLRSRGEAIRSIVEAVNNPAPNNNIEKYPADYTLFHLGEFDDETGLVQSFETPVSLGVAQEFKQESSNGTQRSPIQSNSERTNPALHLQT